VASNPNSGTNRTVLILGVIGVAVIAAVLLIALSLGGTQARFNEAFFANIEVEEVDGGFIIGDPEAPVTIVEFLDYLCPACQQYKPTADRFIEEYVATGKARWEVRIFPTAGGATTEYAGNLAYCAAEQGKHWGYVTEVMYEMAQTGQLQRNPAQTLADRLSLNISDLLRCVQESTRVQDDVSFGRASGATGTPTILYRLNEGTPLPVSDRSFTGLSTLVDTLSAAQ
jgi:protein-disulfide isomerase